MLTAGLTRFLHLPRVRSVTITAQGPVSTGESLVQAAERQLLADCGADLDVWPVGQVPAGVSTTGSKVFFLPMRAVRGQPKAVSKGAEFAWLTKEEVEQKVGKEYWAAVGPILSDC